MSGRLLICLHGFTGTPRRMRARSGLDQVAEELGAGVVYLRGEHRAWPFWQASTQHWYQSVAERVGLLAAGVDSAVLVGFSAGAYMAIRLGVTLSLNIDHVIAYGANVEAWEHVDDLYGRMLPGATFLANAGDRVAKPDQAIALAKLWQEYSPIRAEAHVIASGTKHDWFPEANEIISRRLRELWE